MMSYSNKDHFRNITVLMNEYSTSFPSYNKSVTIVSSNVLHFLFVREVKVYVISKASVHYSVVKINMYISIRILFDKIMK